MSQPSTFAITISYYFSLENPLMNNFSFELNQLDFHHLLHAYAIS